MRFFQVDDAEYEKNVDLTRQNEITNKQNRLMKQSKYEWKRKMPTATIGAMEKCCTHKFQSRNKFMSLNQII